MAIKTFTSGEVLTAADTNTYLANSGLVYITSATVGSGVSTVTVSNAFSSTYSNYKIILTGGTQNSANSIELKLGSSTTGYNYALLYASFTTATPLAVVAANASSWIFAGGGDTNGAYLNVELLRPFEGAYTQISSSTYGNVTTAGWNSGIHKVAASYTDFTLIGNSTSTLTGGTITVYGYRKA
jgi:hypothetical protein